MFVVFIFNHFNIVKPFRLSLKFRRDFSEMIKMFMINTKLHFPVKKTYNSDTL